MTVLPQGDVKSHLSELVGRVHDHHERVTVTVHGKPSAILIAPDDRQYDQGTRIRASDATQRTPPAQISTRRRTTDDHLALDPPT